MGTCGPRADEPRDGLNAALRQVRGDIIVRMDVHSDYADDYVAECIASLLRTGADNVGGPWRAEPEANGASDRGSITDAGEEIDISPDDGEEIEGPASIDKLLALTAEGWDIDQQVKKLQTAAMTLPVEPGLGELDIE